MPNRRLPSAPNMPTGKAMLNHAKLLFLGAPVRRGLNRPDATVGIRAVGEMAQSGKAVTGVAATDLFTSAAHGYGINDRVKFTALTGGAGLTPGIPYYIIASGFTVNDFRVSLTPGGATIDITTDLTAGTVTRWVPNQYAGSMSLGQDRKGRRHSIPGPRKGGRVS